MTTEQYNLINQKSTDYLIYMSQNVSFAKLHADLWSKEVWVSPKRRGELKDCIAKLNWIEKTIRLYVPPAQQATYKEKVIDEDTVIMVCQVHALMMSMTAEEQYKVLGFTEELLKTNQ
jgi:hypothetical protein